MKHSMEWNSTSSRIDQFPLGNDGHAQKQRYREKKTTDFRRNPRVKVLQIREYATRLVSCAHVILTPPTPPMHVEVKQLAMEQTTASMILLICSITCFGL